MTSMSEKPLRLAGRNAVVHLMLRRIRTMGAVLHPQLGVGGPSPAGIQASTVINAPGRAFRPETSNQFAVPRSLPQRDR